MDTVVVGVDIICWIESIVEKLKQAFGSLILGWMADFVVICSADCMPADLRGRLLVEAVRNFRLGMLNTRKPFAQKGE